MNIRPTLQDLAISAHVNKSTVSRALRGDPRILPATRERIEKLAAAVGYIPDPTLSAQGQQRMKRSHEAKATVAVLINRKNLKNLAADSDSIGDDAATKIFDQVGSNRGYAVVYFNRVDYPNSAALARVLKSRGIRALIIAQEFDPFIYQDFPFENFTTVVYKQSNPPLPLHTVSDDTFSGVVLAWEKLVAAGYRRIGVALLRHPIHIADDQRRIAASDYCQNHLSPIGKPIPTYYYRNEWSELRHLPQWIRNNELDAVLGFNSMVYAYLQQNGILIPEDVGFAALIKTDLLIFPKKNHTTNQSVNRVGFAAKKHGLDLGGDVS